MSTLPFITIAIPCLNEEAYIEACIRSVDAQDYPRDRMEILVADGGSTDRTREILSSLAEADPRIRMIDNPDRIQAAGMNEMIKQAKGEVIVRMDVHADYAKDYVSKSIDALERTGADNAGGAARARARSWFQKALCAALESPLGVGGSKYRDENNEGFVETVWNGAFRRRVFETVGMYDRRAITNEDAELNQRIIAAGGKVFLSKDIVVY
jgi:succinoglycan biosynthesis protein ExoA